MPPMRERVAAVSLAAGFLSLATNRLPALPVAAFLLAAAVAVRKPDRRDLALAGVWAFWVLSFLMTGESLGVLFSFDFHRRDGLIFLSMLPLLAARWTAPPERPALAVLGIFCAVQAVVALSGAVASAAGAREALAGILFMDDEGTGVLNYVGLYRAHNAAGSVQALCCLAAAAVAVFGRGRGRWFWGLVSLPLLWGVLLSRSRGSLLALVASGVVLGVLAWRRGLLSRRALIGTALAAVATAALFGPMVVDRFRRLSRDHAWRLAKWDRAVEEWTWSPVVGEGLGRYNDGERTWRGLKGVVYVVTEADVRNDASHAHNSYLHFLAEGGVVGLFLTAGFWAWTAWGLRRARDPLRVAALLGIVCLFGLSMTEHYMGGGAMLLVLAPLAGAARAGDPPAAGETGDPAA